jgi:hypothetical protein
VKVPSIWENRLRAAFWSWSHSWPFAQTSLRLAAGLGQLAALPANCGAVHSLTSGAFPAGLGQQSLLNPELQAKIIDGLRMSGTLTAAALYAGIDRLTLARWLNIGEKAEEGSQHRSLYNEVLNARGSFIIAGAGRHHRWAIGGIIEKPRLKTIVTETGAIIRTDEVELDQDGNPVMVKSWLNPDVRAIEWEMARLAPEDYASPDAARVTQINNQKTELRPSLIAVLEQLGPIPDDDYEDYQAANKHKLNGGGNNGSANGTGQGTP